MKLIRSWLILKVENTNKVVILKRSKKSRNSHQWDFIGGSAKRRKISPRKLIRKESYEEIGFMPSRLRSSLVVVEKLSIYYYYISTISLKQLAKLELSKEHSNIKVVNMNKLRKQKNLHHSIKIFLKWH